jgi:hypothetical protein
MHPTAAAAASTGTRACPSRDGTHRTRRESMGAVGIRHLWGLHRGRGPGGCWKRGREARRSWQSARTSERSVGGVAPTMSVVGAQACFRPTGPRSLLYSNLVTRLSSYSDSAYLESFFNNPPASHDPANRPKITQTPLIWFLSSVLK